MHGLGLQAPRVQAQARAGVDLLQILGALPQVVQDGRQGAHDGRGAEPVGDHGEVGEVTLDGGVQQGGRVGVAEGGAVLVQQVHQLLADHSTTNNNCYYGTFSSNQDIALLIRQLRNSWNQ